jgi:ABC-type phosphate/phosphonate transport system substrate-binding protein
MIASLGMYDPAPLHAANDRYWALIRDGLRAAGLAAPDTLTRGEAAGWPAWTAPDLVLSQTCGFPFRARLHRQVTLIGTPDYGLPGCPPGYYTSVLVARADDPRRELADFAGARFAYNEAMSQSGWAGPGTHLAALGISLQPVPATGSHRLSATAVARGQADLAGIDAQTWRLMTRHFPKVADRLKVVCHTAPTPGLPYIAAHATPAAPVFAAVSAAIDALTPGDRDLLGLRALITIPAQEYLAIPTPPAPPTAQPREKALRAPRLNG